MFAGGTRAFLLGFFCCLLFVKLQELLPAYQHNGLSAFGGAMRRKTIDVVEDAPKEGGEDPATSMIPVEKIEEQAEGEDEIVLNGGMIGLDDSMLRAIEGEDQYQEERRLHHQYLQHQMKKFEATMKHRVEKDNRRLQRLDKRIERQGSNGSLVDAGSDQEHRRLWGGGGWNWFKGAYYRARSEMWYYYYRYMDYRRYYYSAWNSYVHYYHRFRHYYYRASSLSSQVHAKTREITNLKDEIQTLKETLAYIQDLPVKLTNEVVNPIESRYNSIKDDIASLDNIASSVADSAVSVIKDELKNIIPTAEDLLDYFVAFMKDFMSQSFCVPYDCIAALVGKNLEDIELYSNSKLSLLTSLEPESCFRIKNIGLNPNAMQNFINAFGGIEALNEIVDKVREFLIEQMSQILALSDDVMDLVDQIVTIVEGGVDAIKKIVPGRRLISVESGETVSVTEASAMAHAKGVEKFKELWGEHVKKTWHERQLASRAADYVVLETLEIELSADFTHTFDLGILKRSGYAGNILEKSVHKSAMFAVPFTMGMIRFVASGGLETSMPYAITAEGEVNATFGYNVGQTNVTVDIVKFSLDKSRKPASTFLNLTGTGQVSGYMALEFAASAGFGLCVGPSEETCLTLEIDASQSTAAGFDAVAALTLGDANYTELEPMYTDVIEYDEMTECDENRFSSKAGYWQYIMEPSFTVSLVGPAGCNGNTILYEHEGEPLQYANDTFCLKTFDW